MGECENGSEHVWAVSHHLHINESGLHLTATKSDLLRRASYRCVLRGPDGLDWQLVLGPNKEGGFVEGLSKNGWSLHPIIEQVNQPFPSDDVVGFAIRDGSSTIAAVDRMYSAKKVLIDRNLSPERKDAMAAICVALILYHQL